MSVRLPEDEIPNEEPWRDREFLEYAIHDRGLSPQTIAYELGVSKSRVVVFAERLGVTHRHRHEPTLRRLYVEEELSPEEIAARDKFDVTPTTVRKYLAEYNLIDTGSESITYGRLEEINS